MKTIIIIFIYYCGGRT